jgi:hypothetical protein
MSESPETEKKRQELLAERVRLEQSMAIIVNLEEVSTSPIKQTAGGPMDGDLYRPQASTMTTAQSVTDFSEC